MAFDEVRFPDMISRGARGGPQRRTQIVTMASGDEERNASWANSRRAYDAAYGIRRADDLAAVIAFFDAYARIIAGAVSRLRDDRFAVWVIGDVRDAGGFFVNLPGKTVEAFEAAGARFYNDAILVTAVGSLPIRAGRQFTASRKLGRTHQNVLVFCKGDPKRATEAVGQVEFGEIDEADGSADEGPQE